VYLQDGEVAEITAAGVTIKTLKGASTLMVEHELPLAPKPRDAEAREHHTLREIHEIPAALEDLLRDRTELVGERFDVEGALEEAQIRRAKRILVLACGTSYHAGLIGKSVLEQLAHVAVDVQLASEFRYSPFVSDEETLAIVVSQSGETADAIEALAKARSVGCKTLAIVNVERSSLAREADGAFYIRAGPEVGVASTKAFVNTLGAFYLLGIHLARVRGALTRVQAERMLDQLRALPEVARRVCSRESELRELAHEHFADAAGAFLLGRQHNFGVALEGALKLKEIAYIHAEGYAAGELKHGPLALVTPGLPIVALVSRRDPSHDVMLSNLSEVRARGARVLSILSERDDAARAVSDAEFVLPSTDKLFFPVPASVALYLLCYHVALARGCAIDKPRNLAKSVTVE
jgi:glucosamine--fructose-6-phosphate aminotransferase (isomerizing)